MKELQNDHRLQLSAFRVSQPGKPPGLRLRGGGGGRRFGKLARPWDKGEQLPQQQLIIAMREPALSHQVMQFPMGAPSEDFYVKYPNFDYYPKLISSRSIKTHLWAPVYNSCIPSPWDTLQFDSTQLPTLFLKLWGYLDPEKLLFCSGHTVS